jgi:RHS repeat-associated protein
MGRQRQAESGSGRWWKRNKSALQVARKRRQLSQRHSLIERLEPRVVLNGAPVAVADPWYSTPVSTTLNVTTQGTTLVANDWDAEGSSLSASVVANPSHGTLSNFQTNGTFTYTPTTNYVGFDAFTYRVSDGTTNSNTVAALIAVGGYLGPRTNQDGPVQDLSLLEGSLELTAPTTPDVTLTYQSATQASAIVVVETSLKAGAGVPSQLAAQLTFNGVAGTSYSYSTGGLTDGQTLRFALPADASALATGRYSWQLAVTTTYGGTPTIHTFTGSTNVVNRNGATAPFGRGWQLAGLDQLAAQTGGVLLVKSDGTTLWFADNGSGGYLPAEGDTTYATLVKNGDQSYTLSDTHGNDTNFSSTGLLTSRVDANGNTTSYTYTSGLLTQITDPFSRTTTLSYTSNRLTGVSDYASRSATLAYDGSGRLTSITQPDPDGAGAQSAPVTTFGYDATTHELTSVTDALSQVTGYTYGTHGRLTQITRPDTSTWARTPLVTVGLPTGTTGNTVSTANPTGSITLEASGQNTYRTDRFGHVTQWIDVLSNSTLLERNATGLVIRLTKADPDGAGSQTSSVTEFGYNALGNVVYQENPDDTTCTWTYDATSNYVETATDELAQETVCDYDAYGNLTSYTDGEGYTTTYVYNGRGLPTSITTPDPDGAGALSAAVTGLAYDSYGRLVTVTNPDTTTRTFGYNTANQLTSETDELTHTTTYEYDTLNRLVSVTDRTSAETTYVYDAVGQLVQETDALGKVTDYDYNNRGWLISTLQPDPDGAGSLARPETVYGYDTGGHLISLGRPDMLDEYPLEFSYDDAGRRIGVWYSGSAGTGYTYDHVNRVTQVTDACDNWTSYSYNWRGQVTQKVDGSDAIPLIGQPLPEDYVTSYEYDPTGQLITETDPRGYTTKYVYDARGLMTSLWFADPDGEDPDTSGPQFRSWNKYTYDRQGRLIDVEETQLRHTSATYDNRDRLTQVTLPDPDGAGALTAATISRIYDNAGRVATQTDELGQVTSYTYDHEGRVLSVTGPDPDGAGGLSAPVESYTYNALGSVLTVTDMGGHVTTNTYDALQRLTQVTEPDPDGGGALTAPVTTYVYGANTKLSQVTDAMGSDVYYEYDSRGHVSSVTDDLGHETTYVYNALDLVTSVTAPDPDGAGALTAPVTTYAYDYYRRLTSVTDPEDGETSYTYDDAGNLLSLTDSVGNETTYAYDGLGRLTIETNEAGQWRSYQYDALNNVTRVRERNGRVLQYSYDLLGQLTSEQWRSGADPGPSITLATTADGGPIDEVQRVGFSTTGAFMSGSTFKLTYSGQTTASIAYDATAAQVQAALEALSNIAPGDVVVTQTQNASKTKEWRLAFGGALGDANLSQTTVDITGLQGFGTKTKIEATDVQGSSTGNEIQTVTLSNATGGTFRLAFEGYITAPLAYNATAGQVEAALEALASVDNVTVTGNAGGPWTVTYGGTQANTDVARLDGDVTAATNGTLVRTLSSTYDAAGQLTAASDPDSSYAITYDHLGRVLTVDNNGTSGVPRVILTSSYDAAGTRASLSASVAGTADFLNSYTHDALDRLTRVDQTGQGGNTVAEKRVDLAYNAVGQFTSIARYKDTDGGAGNEVATAAYGYDSWARVTSLAYTKGGTNLFTPYSWTYDSLSSSGMDFGETPTVADPRVSATGASAVFAGLGRITQMVSQDGTSTYGYDATSQLTSATHTYQSNETYTYDANGNRTMSGYQTGTDNRLTNDGTYTYTYDAEGNRLTRTKTATGELTEYTWDYRNRLTRVTEKNAQGTVTQVVEYIYDVFDRRIGRKIDTTAPFDMANAVIERYVLDDIHNGLASADGGNVVLDFVDPDGSGAQAIAMSKRYLYGEAVDQLFAQEDLSKTLGDAARNLWPLVDHLGTVRDLAKQDGTIAAHYKYDSFGNVTSGDTSQTRYLFTSREFDTATKLQYNRARYYDAAVGRWISEDPLGFVAGDWNQSRYVGNCATNTTDPSGLAEPAFYRLRRESEPGDWFYPGRNPGESFWGFCLRSISLTWSNPSFQGSMAIGGPGSNFGGALNQNLRLRPPTEEPMVPTNPPRGRQGGTTKLAPAPPVETGPGEGAGNAASHQLGSIAKAQQRIREGRDRQHIIDDITKSEQRLKNVLRGPYDPSDWE